MTHMRTHARTGTALVIAVAVVLTLMLAACGSNGSDGGSGLGTGDLGGSTSGGLSTGDGAPPSPEDPTKAVMAAGSTTLDIPSAHLRADIDLDVGGEQAQATIDGTVDFEREAGVTKASLQQGAHDIDLRIRTDGTTAWVTSDQIEEHLEGAKWAKTTLSGLEEAGVFEPPSQVLDVLLALRGARNVTDKGTTTEGGTPVRVYAMDLDLDAAKAASTPEEAKRLDEALDLHGDRVRVTAEVAVDANGVIRHLSIDGEAGGPDSPIGQAMISVDLRLDAIGKPVPVPEAPPASKVQEAEPDELAEILS